MKAKVFQTSLADALQDVVRVAAGSSSLPVLQNILVEAEAAQQQLTLSATDLEQGVQRLVPATVKASGAVTVPAKTLFDWVKTIEGDAQISLSMPAEDQLRLKAPAQSTLTGIKAAEFPPARTDHAETRFMVQGQDIQNVLAWTGFAAAKDEVRPVLTGVRMLGNTEAQTVTLMSADGFRSGKAILPFEGQLQSSFDVIMPAQALTTLATMKMEGPITVSVAPDWGVWFAGHDFCFWLLAIDGKYPDINQTIPAKSAIEAIVDKQILLTALKRAHVVAGLTAVLFFDPTTGDAPVLRVRGEQSEIGSTTTTIPVELRGKAIYIGFNAQFLTDIVKACPSDEVVIGMNANTQPTLIRPKIFDGEKAPLWVLMPLQMAPPPPVINADWQAADGA